MKWQDNVRRLMAVLEQLSVWDVNGREIGLDEGFDIWCALTREVRRSNKTIFLIGNGGSASMASHFSADVAKNRRVRSEVFTDPSLITAVANDISFEQVFAEPLRRKMSAGDMLVVISSSGNSPNVLRGAEAARELKGSVVTLSAMDKGNSLRRLGDLNFYIPARTYGFAETGHAAILHYWIDRLED